MLFMFISLDSSINIRNKYLNELLKKYLETIKDIYFMQPIFLIYQRLR